MKRRDFVKTASMTAASLSAVIGGVAWADDHKHHEMGDAKTAKIIDSGLDKSKLKKIAAEARECIGHGETCVIHCATEMSKGDGALAECQVAVLNMLAACEALAAVVTYNTMSADRLKQFINLCADICDDCAKACEMHAKHHKQCGDCMKSCRECAKACRAATA